MKECDSGGGGTAVRGRTRSVMAGMRWLACLVRQARGQWSHSHSIPRALVARGAAHRPARCRTKSVSLPIRRPPKSARVSRRFDVLGAPCTPFPTQRPSHTSHPPAPHHGAELSHGLPATTHALTRVGGCPPRPSMASRAAVHRVSPPPSRTLQARSSASGRVPESPGRPPRAVRLPRSTSQTARRT